MHPERRKALEERRRALQRRLRREAQKQRLSFELEALDRRGVSCELLFETDALWSWLDDHFPTTTTCIDWQHVAICRCWHAEDLAPAGVREIPAALAAQVRDAQEEGEAPVEVLYSHGRRPALRLRLADVLGHSSALVGWTGEAWILNRTGGWIIEYVAGERWCWGRARPRPDLREGEMPGS